MTVAYQQGQPDAFFHHYDYDKNNRLTVAYTSLDGTTKAVRAKYFYYLHGPLKRVELGNNIQGIDYVYNIDGSLKFINHPNPTKDVGKDGLSGANAGFQPDVFGMALDYNSTDYTPAGYADAGSFSLPGAYPDQFGGAVKSIRWHSPTDSHVPRGYAFNYDNGYQLTNADFGSVTGTSSYGLNINTVSGTPNFQQYKEAVTNYDKNGNIYALTRKGKTGNSLANYNYTYMANTNKLASVTNGGSALLNYQYNSIGQLIQQTEGANTMKITYTAYGLTKEIRDGANKLKASYAYDDRGNRVKKTIYNSSEAVQNVTYYVSDAAGNTLATYEQDVAGAGSMYLTEVPIYAAGRVGIYKPLTSYSIYEVNDHLGNVRGVVGNPEPFNYTATMEDNGQPVFSNPRVQEMAYFKNLFATTNTAPYMNRTAPSTAVPAPNTSSYTYWKSGFPGITPDIKSIGPAIGITVQPGDKLDVETYVKFETKPSYSRSSIAGSMATLLANSFVNTAVGLETVAQASEVFNNGLASALSATGIGNGNETNNRPHAYLYYLLYDRNFNFVTAGWKRVSATSPPGFAPGAEITSVHERVSIPQITITDPGYVYIYVANESEDTRVWWDDLKITHLRSNIVAGADYYPFGLPMENREITREDYRYGYQGQFAEKDKETGWNAFELRMYDARIGRATTTDPYGQFASPYMWVGNNPITGIDPDGGWAWNTAAIGFGIGAIAGYAATGDWQGALIGGAAGGLLGGAMFKKAWVQTSGGQGQLSFLTKKTVLSPFGKGLLNTFENLFRPMTNTMLNDVLVEHKSRNAPEISSNKLPSYGPQGVKPPNFPDKVPGPPKPPCPDLTGVSFSDEAIRANRAYPRLQSGGSTLARIRDYVNNGGRISVTGVNTRHRGGNSYYPVDGVVPSLSNNDILRMRLNYIVGRLNRMGVPPAAINTRGAAPRTDQGNSSVTFDCD